MSELVGSVSRAWLDLREPADASARAVDLVVALRRYLGQDDPLVVHDLGCGTGSMTRWLAPQLAGPQHWVVHDRDATLLRCAARLAVSAADGATVTVDPRLDDLTELHQDTLAGASLVTASALLDVLTGAQVRHVVAASRAAGCPVLLTLTVIGQVELTPSDPLDGVFAAAFNDHQRRPVDVARLLGPDAVAFTAEEFARAGAEVLIRPSVWRLGAAYADLSAAWLAGWIDAACEQQPQFVTAARAYARRRADELAAGSLRIVVHHHDLLAIPVR